MKKAICPRCFEWEEARDWQGLRFWIARHGRDCFQADPKKMALNLLIKETGEELGQRLRFTNGTYEITKTKSKRKDPLGPALQALIRRRQNLRQTGQYQEADSIRDKLKALNISLEDKADGTTEWRMI